MPPRTRAVRAPKASKENIDFLPNHKGQNTGKGTKPARKPLGDKTNSASDENASPEPVKKVVKKDHKSSKPCQEVVPVVNDGERPRRNRRLPPRYVENQVLNNLSNGKENVSSPNKTLNKTPVKDAAKVESPFKTPINALDDSLIANRPKRVSRLPSKFDENSVSPNKFVPTQCHTSTPLVPKVQAKPKDAKSTLGSKQKLATQKSSKNDLSKTTTKVMPQKNTPKKVTPQKGTPNKQEPVKGTPDKVMCYTSTPEVQDIPENIKRKLGGKQNVASQKSSKSAISKKGSSLKIPLQMTKLHQKKLVQKQLSEVVKNNIDTNVNGRPERVKRLRKPVEYKEYTLSPRLQSPENGKRKHTESRKILKINSSFRVLEEKKSEKGNNQDIYEFTFDPTEEPPPQKKKRKKTTAKKTTKPKTKVYNNNYEKNIARALADLKNVVSKQNQEEQMVPNVAMAVPANNNDVPPANKAATCAPNPSSVVISTVAEIHTDPGQNTSMRSNISSKNHHSICVEDIAADFDASIDHHDDINYSPVNSPNRDEAEPEHEPRNMNPERNLVRPDDPLNLRTDLSFFDEQPVASSSMNVSSRNPTATPWRVEFENLPIKWQANTYVKPDMTPALECSFINNFDDSKKKHVYTDIVPQTTDILPETEDNEAPKLRQTSIISFIKEVVEKSSKKKKRGASATPTKAISLFDVACESVGKTQSVATPRKETSEASNNNNSADIEIGCKPQKRKNNVDNNPIPAKLPRKDNENTLFGFDDSENQENVSPVKIDNNRLRSLRSRSGAVLKELNKQTGPMRAELPAAMKSKLAPSSEAVEKIYDQMKSATDAPQLLDKQGDRPEATNIAEMPDCFEDDSQSVHLFEDIELVHHLKPTRKSYGKAKKVTFQNSSDSASEDEAVVHNHSSDDDVDDLADLSFHMPEVKTKKATKKKKTKKQLLSKKEKAEVDAWAACFNSMCEDIEEFDLVVE